ncbi:MAG: amidase [Alphaproteobacteria bacterium]|nr:MAG: amidase [Alphaproteobacteria bacterium]
MAEIALHRLSIAELRAADAVAVTEHYLDRIARLDPRLRAFTHVDADRARVDAAWSAALIDRGEARPLEGVPIGIKANIDVDGWPTTAGVEGRRDAIATSDAAVVRLLRDAGAVIIGQLNMHEAALGATTDNPAFGRTENPHGSGRTPGGSSGGSGAAVAAGLCAAALGTDTLGSVRIPAAFNGVYGLKPTNGLLPDDGLVFLCRRLDSIGPLARSVADLGAVFAALSPGAATSPLGRVATLSSVDGHEMEPAVRTAYTAATMALRGLGLVVETVATPGLDLAGTRLAGFIESAREAAATFAAERRSGGTSGQFNALMDFGSDASAATLAAGEAAMADAAEILHRVLTSHDVVLLPTTPQAAFAHGRAPNTQADFTAIANIAGLPALSLPAGVDADGLPVAAQLIGRAGSEPMLLELAARLDTILDAYRFPADFA